MRKKMCVRFHVEQEDDAGLIIEEALASPLMPRFEAAGVKFVSSGDVLPTLAAAALAPDRQGGMKAFPMKWGFTGFGSKPIVNARTETAAEKKMFAESWRSRRCALPASWYYEWTHPQDGSPKQKYQIGDPSGSPVWICGLYRLEQGLPVFTVLTRDAEAGLELIHDRMPLILPQELVADWVSPDQDPYKLAGKAITALEAVTA